MLVVPITQTFPNGLWDFQLAVKSNVLTSKNAYTFTMTSFYGFETDFISTVSINININKPPIGGVFDITPATGIALQDTFKFSASSWTDAAEDFPLSYAISYYTDDQSKQISLKGLNFQQSVSAVLGQGLRSMYYAVNGFLKVVDLYGGQATTTRSVVVNPPKEISVDNLAAQFDTLKRINNILIDFSRDVWQYISMEYFTQQVKEGEVGSSAMPHKVNPIDFENAEGNLGVANSLFEHMSAKLPISRLQRDLTDSTVLRNIGVPLAHSYLALLSIKKGLGKLVLNHQQLNAHLNKNWAVVAEGIQTILRREKYPQPYEALKKLTRGHAGITQETMHQFIEGLEITEELKNELKQLTPFTYTGT